MVTTLVRRARLEDPATQPRPEAHGRGSKTPGLLARHPEWPLIALIGFYPVWWLLGIGSYVVIFIAIPMALRMYEWHVRSGRKIRVPAGFGLWLMFLFVTVASVATISLEAPETIQSSMANRIVAYAIRLATYLGLTVMMVYAGNLTEAEYSRRKLAWLLGLFALYAVIGGLGGVIAPYAQFTSPLGALLPGSLKASSLGQSIMHPGLAQLHSAPGSAPRPEAPFDYTNTWGASIVQLLPWLAASWWSHGKGAQRLVAAAALCLSVVPLVFSQDRGAWIAVVAAVGYIALRLALRGKLAMVGSLVAGLVLVGVALAATPLPSVISQKLTHASSNSIRASQAAITMQDALASPVLGFGDTRHMRGSPSSITIGPSANCPGCGQYVIGGNGQIWLTLICTGLVGTLFYVSFFAYGAWRYRHDRTPYGEAGVLVILVTFVVMFTYDLVGTPLVITMLSYAVLWRNERELHQQNRWPAGRPRKDGQGDAVNARRRFLAGVSG